MRNPVACLVSVLLTTSALAAPTQLRLSVVGDPRTTMGVAWTTGDGGPSVVEARVSGSAAAPQVFTDAPGEDVPGIGYVHTVTLSGLLPAHVYEYRAGDGTAWTDWSTFRTGGDACEPWSFIALGDDRADPIINSGRGVSTRWGPILQEAAASQPPAALVVNSGDLVYDGSQTDQWVDWLTTSEPVTASLPHMPIMGNHDAKGEDNQTTFNRIFFLPHNDEEDSSSYYSFRWGNALFIGLNTAGNKGGTAADARPFARQAAWMRRTLEANPDAVWRVLVLHHPLFTVGGQSFLGIELGHPPNEAEQNAVLLPLLDEFHVDFVLAGHNHWYERYEALTQGGDLSKGVPAGSPDEGTQHIVTGGAGAVTLDIGIGDLNVISLICGNVQPGLTTCLGDHHYLRFDIRGRTVTVTTTATVCQNLNCDGQSRVIETFSYTKAGADPCTVPASSSSSASSGTSSSSSAGSSSAAASSSSSAAKESSSAATPSSSSAAAPSSGAVATATSTAASTGGAEPGNDGASSGGGCSCGSASPASWALLGLAMAALRPRRRPGRAA